MKDSTFHLAAALALCGALSLEAASPEDAQPELSIANPVHDWGTAFRGERIEHAFTIKNTGAAPLNIKDVKPQCGCTLPQDYVKVLQPGESTTVALTLETGSLTGDKQKYTEIISDALTEDNKLWMQGDIVDLLTLDPPMPRVDVVLGTSSPRPPALLRLTRNLDREVRILSLTSAKGLVDPTFKPLEDGQGFEVAMQPRVNEDDEVSFRKDTLEIHAAVGDKPVDLRFPVTIALHDRIRVDPSKSVHFSRKQTSAEETKNAAAPATPPRKVLEVVSIGDVEHRFAILSVATEKGLFHTQTETVEEGKRYRLIVEIRQRPEGSRRFVRDKIVLRTDDPKVPLLEVPAMAQFGKAPEG